MDSGDAYPYCWRRCQRDQRRVRAVSRAARLVSLAIR
jgi:hypothetical protein